MPIVHDQGLLATLTFRKRRQSVARQLCTGTLYDFGGWNVICGLCLSDKNSPYGLRSLKALTTQELSQGNTSVKRVGLATGPRYFVSCHTAPRSLDGSPSSRQERAIPLTRGSDRRGRFAVRS